MAVEWYEKAANQGDDDAAYLIGNTFYWGGEGVDRNRDEAVVWWGKAAD